MTANPVLTDAARLKRLEPGGNVSVLSEDRNIYDLSSIRSSDVTLYCSFRDFWRHCDHNWYYRSPRVVGGLLKLFVWLIDSWLFPPIRALLERNNRIPQTLAETDIPEPPLFLPVHDCPDTFANAQTSELPAPPEMAAAALKLPGAAVLRHMHVPTQAYK